MILGRFHTQKIKISSKILINYTSLKLKKISIKRYHWVGESLSHVATSHSEEFFELNITNHLQITHVSMGKDSK